MGGISVSPAIRNLLGSWRYPIACLCGGTGSAPVNFASLLTAPTKPAEGRLRMHSRSRSRFCAVWELCPRPSMQFQPSHQADDMGAMFVDPSEFSVEMITTGVP